MSTRLRFLQAATALLYLGPLIAGMAGQGWAMVAPFLGIFMLWSVILRPHLWPAPGELGRREALVPLLALIATQALIVVLCMALGRGVAGVFGLRLALPLWLPAAISFLSVPLCRLSWRFEEAAPGFDPLRHRWAAPEAEGPEVLIAALSRLPETAGELEIEAHLLASRADPQAVRQALAAAPGPVFARARLVHATEPGTAQLFAGSRYAASLFPPQDMALYAARALRVVEDDPALAADFPPPETLLDAARGAPEAAESLQRLAGLIRAAQPAA